MKFDTLKDEYTLPDDPLMYHLRRSAKGEDSAEQPCSLQEGISLLLAFIQANWLGPLTPIHQEGLKTLPNFDLAEQLSSDGQTPYHLLRAPTYLLKSCAILSHLPPSPTQDLWLKRAYFCWQRSLEGRSQTLMDVILKDFSFTTVSETFESITKHSTEEEDVLQMLERVKHLIYYGREGKAWSLLQECSAKADFHHSFIGALGRRTRYQSHDVTQLTLDVFGSGSANTGSTTTTQYEENEGPTDIALNDDLLLDRPSFNEEKEKTISQIGKAILLTNTEFLSTFNAKDNEVLAKASSIMENIIPPPSKSVDEDWSLLSHSLQLRSKLEESINRKVERAAFQVEALVNQFYSKMVPFWQRLSPFFFTMKVGMDWELDIDRGSLFFSLGSYRSAAKVFEARGIWDRWIECMICLGENERALKCLEAEIAATVSAPNSGMHCAKLLCILGDLKGQASGCPAGPVYYERAWSVSGKRYPRAQRSLAIHHLKAGRTVDGIGCLRKALEINALSGESWHLLGCALLDTQDWTSALQAFGRCVMIGDDGEAWNNMCTCHLNLAKEDPKHEEEAFSCLKEASKILSESPKTFGNLFRLSMCQGKIVEASLALERLIDIHFRNSLPVPEISDNLSGVHQLILAMQALSGRDGESKEFLRSLRVNISRILEGTLCTEMSTKPIYWKMCILFSKACSLPLEESVEFGFKALRACDDGVSGGGLISTKASLDQRIEIINGLEEDILKLGSKEKMIQFLGIKESFIDLLKRRGEGEPMLSLMENKNK